MSDTNPAFFEVAFKHKRFQELNEKAKRADELEQEKKTAAEAALKEKEDFKGLATQREGELNDLKSKLELERKSNAVISVAVSKGASDPDAVVKLLDLSKVEVDENGQVKKESVEAQVDALLKDKPYLISEKAKANIGAGGGGAGAGGGDGKPVFKESELRKNMQDHQWYKDHIEEVNLAYKEGRVLKDQ